MIIENGAMLGPEVGLFTVNHELKSHVEEAVSALDIQLDEEEIEVLEAPYVPHIKTGLY